MRRSQIAILYILFEVIWLVLLVATVMASARGAPTFNDWIVISVIFALMVFVHRPRRAIYTRSYYFLKILLLPLVFFAFSWFMAHGGRSDANSWVPLGVLIVFVFSVLLRRLLPLTIGRIPGDKRVWRISVSTLLALLYLSLIYIAFWLARWRPGAG